MLIVAEIALEDYYKLRTKNLSVLTNGRHIFRCHEFVRCFFGVSPRMDTPWLIKYTSPVSMSNKCFYVFEDSKR